MNLYKIFFITFLLTANNVYAGKCKVKIKVENKEEVKIKITGFGYKCGGVYSAENFRVIRSVLNVGEKWTSVKQKLDGCLDGQLITNVYAFYRKYTKHMSSKKWSEELYTTEQESFNKSCKDGMKIPPSTYMKAIPE